MKKSANISESMAGSRWNSVQRGVAAEAIGQLTDMEVVTIIPFDDTVQTIGPGAPKCRFPLRKFTALPVSCSSSTKLYEAMALGLIKATELHRAVDAATHLTRTTYCTVRGCDSGRRGQRLARHQDSAACQCDQPTAGL
jgi:hypothetical protein